MYYAQYPGVNLLIQLKIIRQKKQKQTKTNKQKKQKRSQEKCKYYSQITTINKFQTNYGILPHKLSRPKDT